MKVNLVRSASAKSYQVLNKTDIAILVIDSTAGKGEEELELIHRFHKKGIPYLIVYNKIDLLSTEKIKDLAMSVRAGEVLVSASDGMNIQELKEKIASLKPEDTHKYPLIHDLIRPMDLIVLVVPIDSAAPKGRLILPQQQTIRDILESGAVSIVVRETELADTLKKLGRDPNLVITDSQAFKQVSAIVPEHVPLTSFSILFARYKGNLKTVVHGAYTLDKLKKGDKILISEGCTHHRQCGDIGTVKLPNLIRRYTEKDFEFEFTSGTEFPLNLSEYQLIIHCGGCMLNEREMKYRLKCAEDAHIPMTNYGTAIAYMNGILNRSISIFRDTLDLKEIQIF